MKTLLVVLALVATSHPALATVWWEGQAAAVDIRQGQRRLLEGLPALFRLSVSTSAGKTDATAETKARRRPITASTPAAR
jgi:hypothetical protein